MKIKTCTHINSDVCYYCTTTNQVPGDNYLNNNQLVLEKNKLKQEKKEARKALASPKERQGKL